MNALYVVVASFILRQYDPQRHSQFFVYDFFSLEKDEENAAIHLLFNFFGKFCDIKSKKLVKFKLFSNKSCSTTGSNNIA